MHDCSKVQITVLGAFVVFKFLPETKQQYFPELLRK